MLCQALKLKRGVAAARPAITSQSAASIVQAERPQSGLNQAAPVQGKSYKLQALNETKNKREIGMGEDGSKDRSEGHGTVKGERGEREAGETREGRQS